MRESRETDEVLVCMAQRLQSQLERQLTLVERLQVHGSDETLADLAELRTSLQRSLRGSENVLVLAGAQQGPRTRGPRSVAAVLADARAAVEDVSRVGLGPAPDTSIAPRAVSGLVALFTELLTHAVAAAAPTGRVEVTSARSEDGGVGVEVAVDGPGPSPGELDELNRRLGDRPIIDDIVSNRVGLFVAARLARRCGVALRVQHRRSTLAGPGIVVVAHCPPDLLDAVAFTAPDAAPRTWTREPAPRNGNGHTGANGNGAHGNGGHGNGGHGNGYPAAGGARPAGDRRPGGPEITPAAGAERGRRPDPLSDPIPGFAPRRSPDPYRPTGPDPVWPEPVPAAELRPGPPPPAGPGASPWSGGGPAPAHPADGYGSGAPPVDSRSGAARTGPARSDGDAGPGLPGRTGGRASEPLWPDEPRRPADPFRPGGAARPAVPPPGPAGEYRPADPLPLASRPLESLPLESLPIESLPLESLPLASLPAPALPTPALLDPAPAGGSPAVEPLWADEPPLSRGSGDAELFGPLTSTLRDRMRESGPNPIYEAVASAWFVDGGPDAADRPAGAAPTDWNTPSDAEWRAASERAARPAGPPPQSTPAGLPRRRPGTQMVAPPRHGEPAPHGGSREREPERVRERLAVYQQGLERGRHRAVDPDL